MSIVTCEQVTAAIEASLVRRFGAIVYTNLQRKDFERPAFFIEPVQWSHSAVDIATVKVSATLRIHVLVERNSYQDSDIPELAAVQGAVLGLFASPSYPVSDRYLSIAKLEGETVVTGEADTAAVVSVSFTWLEDTEDFTDPVDVPIMRKVHAEINEEEIIYGTDNAVD